ncbi:MAG: (deoxy)nucleoside triphosphate pyrophosphohydrolase [Atopobiaceae bacterium]|nr:(deoxy)nucleoside triphosphate pyrophosphohydrolase [Atopobiaceae bacterium]
MKSVHASAAIIMREGTVFCAHRTAGDAGPGWEFPGGPVENGESAEDTLRRVMREKLGVRVSTMWLLDTVEYDCPDYHLTMDCFVCALVPGEEPQPVEHDEVAWLDRDGLLRVDWLSADRRVVSVLGSYWDQIFSSMHL